jgi:long-chain acyl-CoA synthetase
MSYDERPWIKQYDSHVPASLQPYPEHSLHEFLRQAAAEKPDHTALITTAKVPIFGRLSNRTTYAELNRQSDALAAALAHHGLRKGDRVAIVMPNCVAFVISYYGVLKAGGVVAATNPTYPPARMQHQIDDCDAEFVICLSMFYPIIQQIRTKAKVRHVIVANIKEYMHPIARILFTLAAEKKGGHRIANLAPGDYRLQDILKRFDGQTVSVEIGPDDPCIFQYTGGTTGPSKGAISTHRALVVNSYVLQKWTGMADALFPIALDQILFLGALPMFHAFGLIAMLTQVIASKCSMVLIPNPRDTNEVIDVIEHYKPNVFLGVPAMYNAVNNHPRVQSGEVSLKSFLFNASGAAPLAPATKREFERLSESVIAEGFGMSELPVATHSNPALGEGRPNSIGLPLPDVECRIVSLDDGKTPVPVGDVGELIVHCINMMRGYHKLPTETANTLREHEGKIWLYTGDIARMDEDGYFYLVDRKKDMALIGGFNVYPASVEKVIKDHPAVLEVSVAAIPHPEHPGQEALKAWVVLKRGERATSEDIVRHCEEYLAGYEIPRRISFIDELPKSAVGKTLRRELIQMEMQDLESQ